MAVPAGSDVNFTVEVSDDSGRFHRLLWGRCPVVTTFDAGRLLRALDRHLAIGLEGAPGTLRLELAGLVRDDRVTLLPERATTRIPQIERRARDLGWIPIDAPFVDIDPTTCQIDVHEDSLIDVTTVLDAWRPRPGRRHDDQLGPGRYPVATILIESAPVESGAGATLLALAGALRDRADEASVQALLNLMEKVPPLPTPSDDRSLLRCLEP